MRLLPPPIFSCFPKRRTLRILYYIIQQVQNFGLIISTIIIDKQIICLELKFTFIKHKIDYIKWHIFLYMYNKESKEGIGPIKKKYEYYI